MKTISALLITLSLLLFACSSQNDGKIAIAILTPVTHPSLEQIEKGFKETMEKSSPGKYRFVTYNAQGNKTLMRGEIEEIAQKDYALTFTIGTSASQMTNEVFSKKNVNTPIVFTCVHDPVGANLIPTADSSCQITGVEELLDLQTELDLALNFKPDIEKLLLIYNPMEAGLIKDKEQLQALANDKNIKLQTVEIFQINELMAKATPYLQDADAVIVLKDNTVVAGLDPLIKLCSQYAIPLIASDLDSPDRGAAMGYGVYEIDFGIEGAKKALQILDEHIQPQAIPVTPVANFTLIVNRDAAIKQGIDPELLENLP